MNAEKAASEPAPREPVKVEAAPVTFRDDRALGIATAKAAEAPAKAAAPGFRDERPLATPSFRDERPVLTPSFRDERPVAPQAATPAPATAAAPSTAAPPAEVPKPAAAPADEPKPFEVGYFLDDRSPMVRQQETSTEEPAAKPATEPAPPPAPSPAAEVPATGDVPTLVALAPGQIRIDGAGCPPPEVATDALDGGLMRLRVSAACHANEFVQISYGGAELIRKLSPSGTLDYNLDCFAGTSSAVELRFADGTTKAVPVTTKDLDKVSKIAVVWRSRVNLDLHVFEYAAKLDQPGHLSQRTPSAFVTAEVQSRVENRGRGFLSSVDDDKSLGDKLEVYTFIHNDAQASGAISLALDNETRGANPSGATCGQGALAEVDFQVAILPRRGQVTRQGGVLTRVDCGTKLTHEARFNAAAMPGLRIRR